MGILFLLFFLPPYLAIVAMPRWPWALLLGGSIELFIWRMFARHQIEVEANGGIEGDYDFFGEGVFIILAGIVAAAVVTRLTTLRMQKRGVRAGVIVVTHISGFLAIPALLFADIVRLGLIWR